MKTKYDYSYVKKVFDSRGYDLISEKYVNVSEKLEYVCRKHLEKGLQKISFSKLNSSGQGCYYCGREKTIKARMIEFDKNSDKMLCEKHNFSYIDTVRKNSKIYIKFVCNNHKDLGIQLMTKKNMERDIYGCKYCSGKELPQWYVLHKMMDINPNVELLESYVNLTTRIKCKCKKHNIISYKTPQAILSGHGCVECGKEKLSQLSFLSLEEYSNRVALVNSDVIVVEYHGQKYDAKFKCKKCGFSWKSNAASMANGNKTCPSCCHYYKGEQITENVLNKYQIRYIAQYKFNDCKDKRPLPFDFYLPDLNICIEYDGRQHFFPVFGEENFKKTILHDKIKDEYCLHNRINLIRINSSYKLIEETLIDRLSKIYPDIKMREIA